MEKLAVGTGRHVDNVPNNMLQLGCGPEVVSHLDFMISADPFQLNCSKSSLPIESCVETCSIFKNEILESSVTNTSMMTPV